MNKLIGGIALLFLVVGGGSSARADGPWCAFYDASTYNCGFYSFEQCYETVRGAGGRAGPIFSKAIVAASRQDSARPGPTQLTPAVGRTATPDARQLSNEHVMEKTRKCAIEQ